MLKIFIAGQRSFGAGVYKALKAEGHIITGVACPNSKYFDKLKVSALNDEVKPAIIDSEKLIASDIPAGTDLLISAHSHHFISDKVRAAVAHCIGYHPSLLPRHRGRDAIKWTIRFKDPVAGGTVYKLNSAVDGGEIILQKSVLVKSCWDYKALWREALFPIGIDLIIESVRMIERGKYISTPQDESVATWEPPIEKRRLFRPELIMIE